MDIKEFKNRLCKLTAEEIRQLQNEEILRIISTNSNLIADIEGVLFDVTGEYGKYKIQMEQLKSLKSTIIEQNRALKVVVQSG